MRKYFVRNTFDGSKFELGEIDYLNNDAEQTEENREYEEWVCTFVTYRDSEAEATFRFFKDDPKCRDYFSVPKKYRSVDDLPWDDYSNIVEVFVNYYDQYDDDEYDDED